MHLSCVVYANTEQYVGENSSLVGITSLGTWPYCAINPVKYRYKCYIDPRGSIRCFARLSIAKYKVSTYLGTNPTAVTYIFQLRIF